MKNGILKKISAIVLGSAMALGIGVAASQIGKGAVKETKAASDVSTLTFTAACGGTGTADDGASWTVASDAAESTYDSTKGVHYGTGKKAVSYVTFESTSFTTAITKIEVYASGASGTSATISATVNNSAFGTQEQAISASNAKYTFTGNATGNVLISLEQTSATCALYCKSIIVTYTVTPSGTLDHIGLSGTYPTSFKTGEDFSHDGMVVTAYYVNPASSSNVTSFATWTGYDMSTAGQQTVTVGYSGKTATYDITVTNPSKYQLIKSTDDLVAGEEYVIGATYNEANYFISTTQNGNNRTAIAATVSNEKVTESSALEVFVLGGESGAWTFSPKSSNDSDKVIYAASNSANHLKTDDHSTVTTKGEFVIAITNAGVATVTAKSTSVRGDLGFNYNNNNPTIFSCYDGIPGGQNPSGTLDLGIYRLVEVEAYAKTFQDTIDAICVVETGNSNPDDLNAAWITLAAAYNVLSSNDKATLVGTSRSLSGNAVQKAIYMYDYICVKYNTQLQSKTVTNYNFMGRTIQPFGQSNVVVKGSVANVNNTIVVITIIASVSVLALGALLLLKKKKEQ